MLEESLENLKSAEGITALGDYVSIDERQQGYVTYRLEVRFEQFQGATHSRLRVTDSKNDGRAGIRQRSFTWPVANPDDPVELVQIADRILQAAAPGAEIQDDRTVFGRCFDGLFEIGFVNRASRCWRNFRDHRNKPLPCGYIARNPAPWSR